MTPPVVPNALQASVCDEQLMSIGGEIALSGNIKSMYASGIKYDSSVSTYSLTLGSTR